MSDRISKAIILIGFVGAVWVTNVEPMTGGSWATASRQPALVNHARSGHGPTGFDQAHEVSLKIHAKGGVK